jgi:AcrR family transcriptional regulator
MTAETRRDDAAASGPASEDAAIPESAKRQQIIEGARSVFFGRGFDAASMGEIARAAKVSKGTLYVYFDSKEALFSAIVDDSKSETAEHALEFAEDADVRTVLTTLALYLMRKISAPRHVALVRMVIGAAEKFPDLARIFYHAGPEKGARRLTAWFAAEAARGRLVVPDPEIAAWQFLGLCNYPTLIGVTFAAQDPPDEARMRHLADTAVATFLAAYAPR